MTPIIFHIDVNSAFLSWTSVDNLENNHNDGIDLRTIPAIIGGNRENRHGIVLAKSESAKTFGIHTGEPVASALRKCPFLVIQAPNHKLYKEYSNKMMNLLHTYTPDIEQLSIDECFLDFTPIAARYTSPIEAATIIKEDIKSQFHFTVNIGIANNKLLAKMASDFKKPDRIHTLFKDEIPVKMWPLPVDDLYMVGHSSAERLKSFGIRTIGELAHTDTDFLQREFKSHGTQMWEYANGIDHSVVDSAKHELKGIGNSITLGEDIKDFDSAKQVLLSLSETVSERLRNSNQLAQNITVEIKYSDFSSNSHQMPLFSPTNTTKGIYEASCQLFLELWNKRPLRLLGIRTGKLLPEDAPIQMNIFDFTDNINTSKQVSQEKSISTSSTSNQDTKKRLQQLDAAVDAIRLRYGKNAIVRGSLLNSQSKKSEKDSSKETDL
ncbi:MAG: DNA polymerase IV [Lachnospiraceae bacterium]|nr:DNA polymerase IV [Lachnospiraceae bacterium]